MHITSTDYKSGTTYDRLLPAKRSSSRSQQELSSPLSPARGFSLPPRAEGEVGRGRAVHGSTASSHTSNAARTRAGRAAQLRLLLTSLQITGFIFIYLFCCRPNIKCHFHANCQAWTRGFVCQRTLRRKTSAFCTDGCSQDRGRIPLQLTRGGFTRMK